MLEVVARKVFKIRISHNRIHMYLKAAGLAHEDPKKKNQRKWVRYERDHSLSAGHIDWHESGWSDLKVCVIIDDASRMILAGGEFTEINTENSKLVVDQLVERYWWLCPLRELIMVVANLEHIEFMKMEIGTAISSGTSKCMVSNQFWRGLSILRQTES